MPIGTGALVFFGVNEDGQSNYDFAAFSATH